MRLLLSLSDLTRSMVSLRSFLKRRSWPVESSSAGQRGFDRGVLQLAQLLVEAAMCVQRLQHLRLERGFHRRQRQIAFVVEIIAVVGASAAAARFAFALLRLRPWARARASGGGGGGGGGTGFLNSRRGVHAMAAARLFSGWPSGPTGGGTLAGWPSGPAPYMASRSMMSRSRTLPSFSSSRHTVSASKVSGLSHKRADHQFAAGLDALGDGDFAFARQKLDRAHLAQIHAHRIVGAVILLARLGGGGERLAAFDRGGQSRRLSPSSASSLSMTLMPISLSIAIVSSICSDEVLSDGSTLFSSS